MRSFRTLVSALVVLTALPVAAYAQSGADLMRSALEAQGERLSGIENLTIVQEVMGMEASVRMEKTMLNGTPILMPVSVSVAGMTNAIPQNQAQADWANPFQEAWVDRAKAVGQETVDGHRVHVLRIDDFSGLEMPQVPGASEGVGEIQPQSIQMWLDADDFVTRKVVMDMKTTKGDGTSSDLHMELFMEDYREVEGYLHPFVTRTVTSGLMETSDMDPDQMRAQLDGLKAQLESMPEAQRNMMEGMMSAQIEQMEAMLGGEGGMEMTITVKEIRVNTGPPVGS